MKTSELSSLIHSLWDIKKPQCTNIDQNNEINNQKQKCLGGFLLVSDTISWLKKKL